MPEADVDGGDKDLLRRAVDFVGRVLLPSGLAVGILYYFGYVHERALFGYFGVPMGALDFTTTDYLVRSAQVVFAPLTTILVVGLVAVVVHQVLLIRLRDHRHLWRAGCVVAGALGLTLLVLGLVGIHRPHLVLGPVDSALALGAGAVLLDYAAWMATSGRVASAEVSDSIRRTEIPRHVLLLGLAAVAAFWWTLNVANTNGLRSAQTIEASLRLRSEAVVLSDERLDIAGYGVHVAVLPRHAAKPEFRYTGLRVLLHTADQWVLVPTEWTRWNGARVVLLPDDAEGVRVDVRPWRP